MQRIQNNASRNPAVDLFGTGKHGFKTGNRSLGDPPSTPGAEWFNTIQEEIARVVEAEGIELDGTQYNQLLTALDARFFKNASLGSQATDEEVTLAVLAHLQSQDPHSQYIKVMDGVVALKQANIPTVKMSEEIILTLPHRRCFSWNGTAYVRSAWHRAGDVFYSIDNPTSKVGVLPVRADVSYNQDNYPDLCSVLGLSGTGTFTLVEARGEFLRVLDNGRGVDVGRAHKSWQKATINISDPSATSVGIGNPISAVDGITDAQWQVNAGLDSITVSNYAGVKQASGGGRNFRDWRKQLVVWRHSTSKYRLSAVGNLLRTENENKFDKSKRLVQWSN